MSGHWSQSMEITAKFAPLDEVKFLGSNKYAIMREIVRVEHSLATARMGLQEIVR